MLPLQSKMCKSAEAQTSKRTAPQWQPPVCFTRPWYSLRETKNQKDKEFWTVRQDLIAQLMLSLSLSLLVGRRKQDGTKVFSWGGTGNAIKERPFIKVFSMTSRLKNFLYSIRSQKLNIPIICTMGLGWRSLIPPTQTCIYMSKTYLDFFICIFFLNELDSRERTGRYSRQGSWPWQP